MGAYQDYIISLTPNHYMKLDVDTLDSGFGSVLTTLPPTTTATTQDGTPLTLGSVNSANMVLGGLDYGDADDTNITGAPWFRRTYSMWAQSDNFNENYSIFSEGGSVRNMTVMFGVGGVPVYIADNDSDSDAGCPWSQAVIGPKLKVNTAYHFGMIWESDRVDTGPDGKGRSFVKGYLNGKLVGEKEIFQWDTVNNEEILTEPGGQLNAHSGNVEIGNDRSIIVSKKVFGTAKPTILVQDMAWWDGVILTDAQMWELFKQGALDTTATVTLSNIPTGSEVRLFNDSTKVEIGVGVETSASSIWTINYTVASTIDARLVVIAPGKKVFSSVITLPREDSEINAGLLLKDDLTYINPV